MNEKEATTLSLPGVKEKISGNHKLLLIYLIFPCTKNRIPSSTDDLQKKHPQIGSLPSKALSNVVPRRRLFLEGNPYALHGQGVFWGHRHRLLGSEATAESVRGAFAGAPLGTGTGHCSQLPHGLLLTRIKKFNPQDLPAREYPSQAQE